VVVGFWSELLEQLVRQVQAAAATTRIHESRSLRLPWRNRAKSIIFLKGCFSDAACSYWFNRCLAGLCPADESAGSEKESF
jgi:hypothetical protein